MSNQAWAVDITYIPMGRSHMYLTAVTDWYSRFIVGWELSDTLESAPVLAAIAKAIDRYGTPSIINSDQGSQFSSDIYIDFLKKQEIRQSMGGKARWVDNVIIERWFRSPKCEYIYHILTNIPHLKNCGRVSNPMSPTIKITDRIKVWVIFIRFRFSELISLLDIFETETHQKSLKYSQFVSRQRGQYTFIRRTIILLRMIFAF